MECRVCDSGSLELAVDLGNHPWGNHFLKKEQIGHEPFYPLRVVWCARCKTAQLDYTVKKEIMFSDHTYLSGMTKTLDEHFKSLAAQVDAAFFKQTGQFQKSVLDIGSNDGTQLKHYKALGYDVLGVESSKTIAKIANEWGIPTLNEFFNLECAKKIGKKFCVINAAGVFFHLEQLHSVTDGIREVLDKQGVFVVQFLYMKRIMENLAFDQIYHEHLLYYNVSTIQVLLRRHGLELFDAYLSPIHGGSIIGFACHAGSKPPTDRLLQLIKSEEQSGCNELLAYKKFAEQVEKLKERNIAYVQQAKRAGKKIFGLGAPVKGNTLLNYFGFGTNIIDCLVEKNPLRKGLYSPGMHIPVVLESKLLEKPDIYYVLAWNFKSEILINYKSLIDSGVEFYFPINPKDA
ncbi:class I SAM-dependent methyltransferase [Candidatus Parvarchaeota archaeon]|nr:class I SAM-dependent methyltransferase [Candidatus Parvarchaeota archaeon]